MGFTKTCVRYVTVECCPMKCLSLKYPGIGDHFKHEHFAGYCLHALSSTQIRIHRDQSWQDLADNLHSAGFTDVVSLLSSNLIQYHSHTHMTLCKLSQAMEVLSTLTMKKALQDAVNSLSREPLPVESARGSRSRSQYGESVYSTVYW